MRSCVKTTEKALIICKISDFFDSFDFGKDEVGGSNPPSSSRKTPEIFGFRVFSFAFCNFCGQLEFREKF